MAFGQGAKCRVPVEDIGSFAQEGLKTWVCASLFGQLEKGLQGLGLERPHGRAVYEPVVVEGSALLGQGTQLGQVAGPGHVLHP